MLTADEQRELEQLEALEKQAQTTQSSGLTSDEQKELDELEAAESAHHEEEKPGLFSRALERVSAYSDAPARAAVMAAIKNKSPMAGLKAGWKQFGAPADTAPTGEDINAELGMSRKPFVEQSVDLPDFPEFGMEMPIGANNYKYISPAQYFGPATELALDPKNLIPVGASMAAKAAKGTKLSDRVGAAGEAVSNFFGKKADEKTLAATGLTGLEKSKLPAGTAEALRSKGIVSAFDSQENIADKARQALDSSGQRIGDKIKGLGASGVTVDESNVLRALRAERNAVASDPSQAQYAKALDARIAEIESTMPGDVTDVLLDVSTDQPMYSGRPIDQTELTRRGYDDGANWDKITDQPGARSKKAAATAYRAENEAAASAADPALAAEIKDDKTLYHQLKPVVKGAERRAAVTAQSPPLGLKDMATAANFSNALKVPAIVGGRIIGPRVNSTLSAAYAAASEAPQLFNQYSDAVAKAAARGPQAFSVVHNILSADPEYRILIQKLADDQNNPSAPSAGVPGR